MILKFKKKEKQVANLVLSIEDSSEESFCSFSLIENGSQVPTGEWKNVDHLGVKYLLDKMSEFDEGTIISSNNISVRIPVQTLSKLVEEQESYLSKILDLPKVFEGGIEISTKGLLHHPDFQLQWKWINGNGQSIELKHHAMFVIVGTNIFRLTSHAFKLAKALNSIQESLKNKSKYQDHLKEIASVKELLELLPPEENLRVKQSSEIANLKVFYADSFRIEATPHEDSFSVRPVLLRKKITENSSSPIFESVLPPAEQERYANSFDESMNVLSHYRMGTGKYLILSEKLNKALDCVHKFKNSGKSDLLEFLKNPKSALLDELQDLLEPDELEDIFSDRVIGIGQWTNKVIPWIQVPSQEWLPDGKLPKGLQGLRIGSSNLSLSKAQAQEIESEIKTAMKDKRPTVQFESHEIPATADTLAALEQIFPKEPVKPENYQSPDQKNPKKNAPPVMLVKENFETLEFVVQRSPRKAIPQNKNLPDRLRTEPQKHQIHALNWLREHYLAGSRGVLLADDMGLGKTFESLMFLAWLREGIENNELSHSPTLIIAPTGLLKNWEGEIDKHLLKDLGQLVRAYGHNLSLLKKGSALDTNSLRNAGLVLSTYETVTQHQLSFSAVNFGCIVLDEAQKLKNPGTQNYNAISALSSDFWICMTGTPIENRLSDLWSIADILQPGMLGTVKEFSTKYEKPILHDEVLANQRLKELQDGLSERSHNAPPFMLRRLKSEELPGLPKKNIEIHRKTMPANQSNLYNEIVSNVANQNNPKPGAMLEALQKLRACSLHPDYKRERFNNDTSFAEDSARLRSCFEILDRVKANKEKALIFVEYNEWHSPDFFPAMLKRRYKLKNLPMVIHGQIDSQSRQKRVDEFQSNTTEFDVMLLSPKAGGVGLTLTAANHVIHLTRWWNPAVEDQATDRIYRIGQKRPVYIHFPLAIHPDFPDKCFDVLLDRILESKRGLRDKTLLSLPSSNDIAEELFQSTFAAKPQTDITLQDSHTWSGTEYQNYVLKRLQKFALTQGFNVQPTPASWDGGADMLIETFEGEIVGLIQCKHVSDAAKTPLISPDLERALISYGCSEKVKLIGITNASNLSSEDRTWLGKSQKNRIYSGIDGIRPEVVFDLEFTS